MAKHPDLEFHAQRNYDMPVIFETWSEARAYLLGHSGTIAVYCYSERAAHAYAGVPGYEAFRDAPESGEPFEYWARRDTEGLFSQVGGYHDVDQPWVG